MKFGVNNMTVDNRDKLIPYVRNTAANIGERHSDSRKYLKVIDTIFEKCIPDTNIFSTIKLTTVTYHINQSYTNYS